MEKGYVGRYGPREKLEGGIVDIDFSRAQLDWGTREAAETACRDLASLHNVKIEKDGESHPCGNFRVEEWKPGKFAVCCDVY
jgi:hypothetical protein